MRKTITMLGFVLGGTVFAAHAQAPGSATVYGGPLSTKSIASGGTDVEVSETLYIGPGTYIIDGTWDIYAKQIVIDPNAVITGAGTMVFNNPSVAGGASSPSLIDGNGTTNAIDLNMELRNASGMQLTELPFDPSLTASGFMDNTAASTLYVGKDMNLAVDGADISLGMGLLGDLRFDADATISNYSPSRMVISNNALLSHMVKEAYTAAFTFPIGIADGDYTPVQVSNASNQTVHVSVQDYANSSAPEALADGTKELADGINRTWHIYGDLAGVSSTLGLQHNSTTNQSGFADASQFVTQWGSSIPNTTGDFSVAFGMSPWQTNSPGIGLAGALSSAGAVAGASLRSRTYSSGLATSASANEAYYTKSSDVINPLPLKLIRFAAESVQCDVRLSWQVGVETGIQAYRVLHSTDAQHYTAIATIEAQGANSNYTYTDRQAAEGDNYYRLEFIDKTLSSTSKSQVVQVKRNCATMLYEAATISLFPNPSTGTVYVTGLGRENQTQVRVLNVYGQVLYSAISSDDKLSLDLSNYPSATYIVQIVQRDRVVLNERVVKL